MVNHTVTPNRKLAGNGELARKSRKAPLPELQLKLEWTKTIDEESWACYRRAIAALRDAGIRFLLGGGFALATYIGHWRNTKDIDFYIHESDREKAIAALTRAGFEDYFPQLAYDRKWIYRSTCAGVIVDIIWAMANQRARVDDVWFDRAPEALVRDELLRVVPLVEFLWCKVYIMQRDHCDWVDIFNVLHAVGPQVDWDRLLARLEDDWPLLAGLLTAYGWLCPEEALKLPASLRRRLKVSAPEIAAGPLRDRVRLLDSRGWFAATLPQEKPLEV